MARIFILLSTLAVMLILTACFSTYQFTLKDIKLAKHAATKGIAQSISQSIANQLDSLQQSLNGIAKLPEVISALETNDVDELNRLADKLEPLIPYELKLRILPLGVSEPDYSHRPIMGFADLVMVQATLRSPQPPLIQGEKGQHRHLAITSLISQNGRPLGVLLASLEFSFLEIATRHYKLHNALIEVTQQGTVLISIGDQKNKTAEKSKLVIPNTSWDLLYWPEQKITSSELLYIIASVALICVIACAFFYYGYRRLIKYLLEDQVSIIKVAKDLMTNKTAGNYPVNFPEMKAIVSTLVQYKRVLRKQEESGSPDETSFDDDFFVESLDSDFLNLDAVGEIPEQTTIISEPEIAEKIESPHSDLPSEPSASAAIPEVASATSMNALQAAMFKTYDIRGIIDKSLNKDIMFKIGQALGSEAKDLNVKTMVVGRDGRNSSRALAFSLTEGILSTGIDVMDIGLIPTPMLYFVSHHIEGRSGAMVTGSHNPPEYNGIKMVLNGETLFGAKIQALKQRVESDKFIKGTMGSIEQNTQFTDEYIGIIVDDIHIERPMKIVLDCGNGAAGELAPTLLRAIGCEVIELYCDIDGNFPNHHPDPSRPENLQDLIDSVKHHQADVGIALDGDGDRLGVVDSSGKIIWPDRQMMLFARDVLNNKPGAEIIYDVKCTRHLDAQIRKFGGRPLMWKTGHSLMKAKLKETGAALAGEMSGHIIFNDRWFGFDDGLYAAARMIETLSADTRSSHAVFADFPDSSNTPELTVSMADEDIPDFLARLSSAAKFQKSKIINIDGLRVEFDDGWALVRASNTTASLVMRFEGDTQQALTRIQEQFKDIMLQIKPDLVLPI